MGMSTHVVGFIEPDEKWYQMKAAWDACKMVGVEPPREVRAFFGDEAPDDAGRVVEIKNAVVEWSDDNRNQWGYEVILNKLPANVTRVRFFNS